MQDSSPSSVSSLLCAQRSPVNKQSSQALTQQGMPNHSQCTPQNHQVPHQQNITNQQQFASPQANSQSQNVAPLQPSAQVTQPF